MKTITHNNIVILLQEAAELMKAGWEAKEFYNSGMYEIVLDESTSQSPPLGNPKETVVVNDWSALELLVNMKILIDNGYEFTDKDFYWDSTGLKRITMINLNIPEKVVYTLSQLTTMPWDELKTLAKKYDGFTGRDRGLLSKHILKSQKEGK